MSGSDDLVYEKLEARLLAGYRERSGPICQGKEAETEYICLSQTFNITNVHGVRFRTFQFFGRGVLKKPTPSSQTVASESKEESKATESKEERKETLVMPSFDRVWQFRVRALEDACEISGACVHCPLGGAESDDEDMDETNNSLDSEEYLGHRRRKMHEKLSVDTKFYPSVKAAFRECFFILQHVFRCIQCDVATNMYDAGFCCDGCLSCSTATSISNGNNTNNNANNKKKQISKLTRQMIERGLCMRCSVLDVMQRELQQEQEETKQTALTKAEEEEAKISKWPITFKCMICLQDHNVGNRQQMFCTDRAKHKDGVCVFCFGKMRLRECPVCREISSALRAARPPSAPLPEDLNYLSDEDFDDDEADNEGEEEIVQISPTPPTPSVPPVPVPTLPVQVDAAPV